MPGYRVETYRSRCQNRPVTNPPRYATDQERSVPLAPLALALSLLVAPVGIVLGVVALRRARRDNERGDRGTAVAAIAVGTVVTLAYVTLVVLLVVLFVELNHSTTPLPPGLG